MSADGSLTTILGTCVNSADLFTKLVRCWTVARAGPSLRPGWSTLWADVNPSTHQHQGVPRTGHSSNPIQGRLRHASPRRHSHYTQEDVRLGSRVHHWRVTFLTATTAQYIKDLRLADPTLDKPGRVDLLLGVDTLPHLLSGVATFSNDRTLCH